MLPLPPGTQDEESTLRVCVDPLSFPKSRALLRAKSSVFRAEVPGGGDRLSLVSSRLTEACPAFLSSLHKSTAICAAFLLGVGEGCLRQARVRSVICLWLACIAGPKRKYGDLESMRLDLKSDTLNHTSGVSGRRAWCWLVLAPVAHCAF